MFVYFKLQDFLAHSKLPLSAARQFSKDLVAGKFKDTAFVFIPDMKVCSIPYYLKQATSKQNADDLLSSIHGCVRWDDKAPYSPAQYEELFKNPNLLKEIEGKIFNLPLDKYPKIALVRESYMPDTEKMPCDQTAKAVRRWLDNTYTFKGISVYSAYRENHIFLVYERMVK